MLVPGVSAASDDVMLVPDSAHAAAESETASVKRLRLAIVNSYGMSIMDDYYSRTIEAVKEKLTPIEIDVKIYGPDSFLKAAEKESFDMSIASSGLTSLMIERTGGLPLAAVVSDEAPDPNYANGAAIIVRADRPELRTLEDLRGRLSAFTPRRQGARDSNLAFGVFACEYFHLVNVTFSVDLEPDCVKRVEVPVAGYFEEFNAFMSQVAAEADREDDPTRSSLGAIARFYNGFPDAREGEGIDEDRTRNTTRLGMVKGFLRFLAEYGLIDADALAKRSAIAPTPRFSAFYASDIASVSRLPEIQELIAVNGRNGR